MANGKGWIDCIDCIHCEWTKDPWKRFCKKYNLLLPSSEELDHQHTICSKFCPKQSHESALNTEVVPTNDGADYYVYKRSGPFYKNEEPVHLMSNVLYAFHYNEQILRSFLEFSGKAE